MLDLPAAVVHSEADGISRDQDLKKEKEQINGQTFYYSVIIPSILGEKACNLSTKKSDSKLADQAVELKLKSVAL